MVAKLDRYQTTSLSIVQGLQCKSLSMNNGTKKDLFSQTVNL